MPLPLEQPDADDLPHTEWRCEECNALNSCFDAECQFCDDTEKGDHPCMNHILSTSPNS